jgi:thymidylate synthase
MNNTDIEYLKILKILVDKSKEGHLKNDRTNTGTFSIFGVQSEYNFLEGFPILTSKKISFKSILVELLWFLGNHLNEEKYLKFGRTNIRFLLDNNVNIWNEWPYKHYLISNNLNVSNTSSIEWIEGLKDFVNNLKNDDVFCEKWGSVGVEAYGKQWRDFNGFDQIEYVINTLKNNPDSRRIIVNSWNPKEVLTNSILPPCHYSFEFNTEKNIYTDKRFLNLKFIMRSNDYFLGNPFNFTSYSLLCAMIAQCVDMLPNRIIVSLGDCHLYSNHVDQAKEQLSREIIHKLPILKLNSNIKNINDFTIKDIELLNYQSHSAIKAPIAV